MIDELKCEGAFSMEMKLVLKPSVKVGTYFVMTISIDLHSKAFEYCIINVKSYYSKFYKKHYSTYNLLLFILLLSSLHIFKRKLDIVLSYLVTIHCFFLVWLHMLNKEFEVYLFYQLTSRYLERKSQTFYTEPSHKKGCP